MDEPRPRQDHRPRKGFWARFSDQETGPQKVLVGLAGTMTALATTIGGVYAVTNLVRDDEPTVASDAATDSPSSSTSPSTSPSSTSSSTSSSPSPSPAVSPSPSPSVDVPLKPGQTLVMQGSKEADALVHALVDEPGGRATLDVVILPTSNDTAPQFSLNLWYNCQGLPAGEPPGADLCDRAFIAFDEAYPPGPTLLKRPLRVELRGIWADARPTGEGYGADGLEIFPAPASF
jgi:hypothetical protein